jgi:hypothetical protein
MKVYLLKDADIEALRALTLNESAIEKVIDHTVDLPPVSRNQLSSSILRYLNNQLEDILHRVTE